MLFTFQDYQKEKLGEFKHLITTIKRNTIIISILLSVILLIFYFFFINEYYEKYKDIIPIIMGFPILIFSFLVGYFIVGNKPIFKDYLMYYIYMGESSLETFLSSKDRPKKQLKQSKYFFKQLFRLLDKKVLETYFEKDIIRNKSKRDLRLITSKYILPKLKLNIKSNQSNEIKKITHTSLSHIYNEEFDKLHNFLEPYIKQYYPKKITTERIINKIKSSSFLFYGFIFVGCIIVIILITYILFWLGYDWDVVIGFYTISGFIIVLLNTIRVIINKPIKK